MRPITKDMDGENVRNYYICKYHFNASHSFGETRESVHSHTFTVILYVGKRRGKEEADINEVDVLVERFLNRYTGSYLNDFPEFGGEDVSIERIGTMFYEELKVAFRRTTFSLYQLDVSENPLSVYQVGDRILLPILNMENSKSNYDAILKQKKQMEPLHKRG